MNKNQPSVSGDYPDLEWGDYAERIQNLHIARFEEIPDLQLYMDQVISFVGQQLALFEVPGDKPLTSSMVNNYVKRKFVPQSQAKRYQPLHAAYLTVVCILKRLYSMDEIEHLISFDVEHRFQVPHAYNKFIDLFEAALKAQFSGRSLAAAPGGIETLAREGAFAPVVAHPDDLRELDRLYLMAATSAASKIYIEQALAHVRTEAASGE